MLKYLFLGSPQIAASILEHLCEKSYPPVAIVTQPAKPAGRGKKLVPTPVETLGQSKTIPVIATDNINNGAVLEKLRELKPDLLYVVAFGQILKKEVLELPKYFCLNLHASLLPKYRGAAPVQWAILNGEKQTGVTVQRIVKKLDAGDILLKRSIEISPTDTTADLWMKLAELGKSASWDALQSVEKEQFSFTPQKESEVTFAPKIKKEQAIIDWSQDAGQILNQIRAFQPWPIASTTLGDKGLRIFAAQPVQSAKIAQNNPGDLVSDAKTFLHVACGQGTGLALTEIQLENRKRLQIPEFLRAFRGSFPFSRVGQ